MSERYGIFPFVVYEGVQDRAFGIDSGRPPFLDRMEVLEVDLEQKNFWACKEKCLRIDNTIVGAIVIVISLKLTISTRAFCQGSLLGNNTLNPKLSAAHERTRLGAARNEASFGLRKTTTNDMRNMIIGQKGSHFIGQALCRDPSSSTCISRVPSPSSRTTTIGIARMTPIPLLTGRKQNFTAWKTSWNQKDSNHRKEELRFDPGRW